MRGTNEEKAQMRHVISNFLARLLKGTFPDKKHYAYFRHVDEGFEEVIHFIPLIVYLAHRIKERSDEVLITARQSGVILPPDFQAKIDFTMSYAYAEAARGKHHRLTNVARNLEETVVKAAIGDVGDTAAAKMGRAAAEAAAKAPPRMETPKSYAPQHPPPSPAAASSSSTPSTASVPKAKQAPKGSAFEVQKEKLEVEQQEKLQKLEREHQEKLLQLQADFETRREEKTQQLRQELERKSRVEAERQVDEKMKMLREQMEYDKRSRLEKEVEEKLRPSQAAIEREARARVQKEAEEKARLTLPDLERVAQERVEREAAAKEEELRQKLLQEAEERARSELPQLEQRAKEALEMKAQEAVQSQYPQLEEAAKQRLAQEAEEKMRQVAAASIEHEVRERLIKEAEERLRSDKSGDIEFEARRRVPTGKGSEADKAEDLEADVRKKMEQEIRDRLQATVEADVERSMGATWEAKRVSMEQEFARKEQELREEQASRLKLQAVAPPAAPSVPTGTGDDIPSPASPELEDLRAAQRVALQEAEALRTKVEQIRKEKKELEDQLQEVKAASIRAGGGNQELRSELRRLEERMAEKEAEHQAQLTTLTESCKELQSDKEKLEAQLEAQQAKGGSAANDVLSVPQLQPRNDAELKTVKENLAKAEAKSKEALVEREKLKTQLESVQRELAQAQSREQSQRAAAGKTEDSLKEAVQSRLELSQELERLKALKSGTESEKTALAARVASLEAQLSGVKSEDGAAQALRQQVSQLEEELSRLREKHLHSASDAAGKVSTAEARAAEADRARAMLEQQLSSSSSELATVSARLKDAQRAESELNLLKPRLADAETQLARSQQEIAKKEGEVATQRAQAQGNQVELGARDRVIQQLKDELNSTEESLKRLRQENLDLEAHRSEALRLKRELAALQGETDSSGEQLRGEMRHLLAEVKEKDSLQLRLSEANAQLSQSRSSHALMEATTADAKEQLRSLRGEMQEQRLTAAEEARRLRSELWEERSAAASAAVVAAGELAALRADRDGAARGASPTREESAVDPLREEVALLKRQRDSTEAELRKARCEMQTQNTQRAQLQSEEEQKLRRLQEELRQAREKLTSTEANVYVFEERQKRLLSEVAAERSEGDQRVQRLRQELRRMEQDSDELSANARMENRRRDQQLSELEKELRCSQRQLAAKEAELGDMKHLQEAKLRRDEVRMSQLDEREELLRSAEYMLRQREADLEGGREHWFRGTWPPAQSRQPAAGKAATSPAPAVSDEQLHRSDSPDASPQARADAADLVDLGASKATVVDAEIEEMLAASIVTMKPQVWPPGDLTDLTQRPGVEPQPDEKGLLELVQKKRRQLKKQRASLLVELERWRTDVAQGRSPVTEKSILEQRLSMVIDGLRETKVVERTLLTLHCSGKEVASRFDFAPSLREVDPYEPSSPRDPIRAEAAARGLLDKWRLQRLSITGSSGAFSARGSSSTVPLTSSRLRGRAPYSARGTLTRSSFR
eukprot:s3874_g1.t1